MSGPGPPGDDATRAADGAPTGAAARGPNGLAPGFVLSHTYVIDRLIARGGMGEVYRARSLVDGSDVALKIIRPDLADDERIRALFSREAGVLRRIRHDAVVGYGGLLRDEQGRTFLVMDYVDGPSLAERLKDGPLAVEQVRRLKARLARGLAVVHAEGTFHRDLSPDNVLLPGGDLERATIIDFGIAKLADPRAGTVLGTDFAGKYAFASPEQLGAVEAPIDQRSDIYSLGLVLAAAAAGRPLAMGQTWPEVVGARKRVPDLGAVPAALRPELAAMLDPDPDRRPQSMAALLPPGGGHRGDALSDGGKAIGPNPTQPTRARLAARAAAVAALAVVGAAAAYWAYWAVQPPVLNGDDPVRVDRAALQAAFDQALDGAGCARLEFALDDAGRVAVAGFVASSGDLTGVTEAVRGVDGVRDVATDGVEIHPEAFCTALVLLDRRTTQPAPPEGIALRPSRPDSVYHEGEHFVVTVDMPEAQSGHLYVDYVDGNGDVVHLLPNPLVPETWREAGESVQLGVEADEVGPGRRHYVVSPPFGPSLLTAIVSPEPLFDGAREEVEAAADYLPALEAGLRRVEAAAPPLGATRFIEIRRPES